MAQRLNDGENSSGENIGQEEQRAVGNLFWRRQRPCVRVTEVEQCPARVRYPDVLRLRTLQCRRTEQFALDASTRKS